MDDMGPDKDFAEQVSQMTDIHTLQEWVKTYADAVEYRKAWTADSQWRLGQVKRRLWKLKKEKECPDVYCIKVGNLVDDFQGGYATHKEAQRALAMTRKDDKGIRGHQGAIGKVARGLLPPCIGSHLGTQIIPSECVEQIMYFGPAAILSMLADELIKDMEEVPQATPNMVVGCDFSEQLSPGLAAPCPTKQKWKIINSGSGVEMIEAERMKQIRERGYDAANDDAFVDGELALAAAHFGGPDSLRRFEANGIGTVFIRSCWPDGWTLMWDNKAEKTPIERLVIGGALFAAEIDRLLRMQEKESDKP